MAKLNKQTNNKKIKQSSLSKFETKKAKAEVSKLNHMEEALKKIGTNGSAHLIKEIGGHIGGYVNGLLGGVRQKSGLVSSRLRNGPEPSNQVGLAEHSAVIRDQVHSIKGQFGAEKILIAGCCMLDVFQTTEQYPGNDDLSGNAFIMKSFMIHPGSLPSARLHALLGLYSKYKFKSFRLEYRPQVPTTTVGAIISAIKQDLAPVNARPGVDVRVELAETESFTEFRVWENAELSMLHKEGEIAHYAIDRTSDDLYTVYQGQVVLAGVGLLAASYYGDLYVHYTIELDSPRVPETHWDYTAVEFILGASNSLPSGAPIRWNSQNASIITSINLSPGIFLCSLAQGNWAILTNAGMENYYGAYFYIRVDEEVDYTHSPVTFYTYSLHKSFAAALSGEAAENTLNAAAVVDGAYVNAILLAIFDGQEVKTNLNPVNISRHSRLGLSFGPGILAGAPDIIPSIDFTSGRFVCKPPLDFELVDKESKSIVTKPTGPLSFRR